jgi:hypothetical protein
MTQAHADLSAVDGPGVPLLALRPRQCRFVIGDRVVPAIFCGEPTISGSWCSAHRQLVYTRSPPVARKRTTNVLRDHTLDAPLDHEDQSPAKLA